MTDDQFQKTVMYLAASVCVVMVVGIILSLWLGDIWSAIGAAVIVLGLVWVMLQWSKL